MEVRLTFIGRCQVCFGLCAVFGGGEAGEIVIFGGFLIFLFFF